MEDDEIKKYIANINTIVRDGNPKNISYISREYMKHKKNNPVIAMVMEDMIRKEAAEDGSVYAIFIDNDNGINLEAMSDISKITNVPDFIKNVEALSDQNVDFGDLTSDELIVEGMEIAEELAREIEELENTSSYEENMSETDFEAQAEEKTSNALNKLAKAGVFTSAILGLIGKIKERISLGVSRIRESNRQKNENEEQIKEIVEKNVNSEKLEKPEKSFIPKFEIDEKAVIKKMNEKQKDVSRSTKKKMENNLDGDIDTDTSDDNFNSDENNSPEDDEPDI